MSQSEKLLFLDMDGVLNHYGSARRSWRLNNREFVYLEWDHLCPISCSNLDFVLEKIPDLKVVISSTWRHHFPFEQWNTDRRLLGECPSIAGRVIGMTPKILPKKLSMSVQRGDEIRKWLDDNAPDAKFIAVDDNSDMDAILPNFLKIDDHLGFTYRDALKVCAHFGIFP